MNLNEMGTVKQDFLRIFGNSAERVLIRCEQEFQSVKDISQLDLAKFIDHTLLKPDATIDAVERLCNDAMRFAVASVCVNSCFVKIASDRLQGSSVVVAATVGFPLGAMGSDAKAYEAQWAESQGAREIDMVLPIGALKVDDLEAVLNDISKVRMAIGLGTVLKVIIETAYLTDREKVLGALVSIMAGADFVKTSTGFAAEGATISDVLLLRQVVGGSVGVKAAGGIRTLAEAQALVVAGADRLGTSHTQVILGKT